MTAALDQIEKVSRGGFFAVDRRVWAAVCELGSINAAVSYLVIARGTLRDMRTTAWSVRSIEDRTGVPRYLARTALDRLIAANIIRKAGSRTKPRYHLVAPHEFQIKPTEITKEEAALLRIVESAGRATFIPKAAKIDSEWPNRKPFRTACELVRKGYLTNDVGQLFGLSFGPEPVAEESEWIWLPASLVDGAAQETAPVELLRQAQSLPTLRLLIDLYQAQSLPRHGGVHWRTIRRTYSKQKVGAYGAHPVWAFSPGQDEVWLNRPIVKPHLDEGKPEDKLHVFWQALRLLEATGLAAFVPHMIEADTEESAVLFPYGDKLSSHEERDVGHAAGEAGLAMLPEWQSKLYEGSLFVPLLPHQNGSLMVGLLRLRYQANTTANAEWCERRTQWIEQARHFRVLAKKAQASQGFATSIHYQI